MERAAVARLLLLAVLAVTAMRAAGNATLCSSASDSLGTEADWLADKHKRRGWPLIHCAGILPPGALR
eukprot:SM000038S14350  [mRNA]  locus=s38:370555:370870:+ [translate_table: standard]